MYSNHGGVTCHDFGYGCAAGVPEPHPIHIPGQVITWPIHILLISKIDPIHILFWKLTPFIYFFPNFTHSYTFWVKKIPHWYTFDVKMIPIHILGGLKSIPHSSRTSVYTFIIEVTPRDSNMSFPFQYWTPVHTSIHLQTKMHTICHRFTYKVIENVLLTCAFNFTQNSQNNTLKPFHKNLNSSRSIVNMTQNNYAIGQYQYFIFGLLINYSTLSTTEAVTTYTRHNDFLITLSIYLF